MHMPVRWHRIAHECSAVGSAEYFVGRGQLALHKWHCLDRDRARGEGEKV